MTVAEHLNQIRQLLLEHPALSNAPMNPEIEVAYDSERDAVVVRTVDVEMLPTPSAEKVQLVRRLLQNAWDAEERLFDSRVRREWDSLVPPQGDTVA